jgi:CRISPR-associated protein Cas5d
MAEQTQVLEVWGDLACFTRPEMKVERFSYPVITPSAARGIFDAIYWEGIRENGGATIRPYFYWQMSRIEVFTQPKYVALRRNEVKDKGPSESEVFRWAEGRAEPEPVWADGNEAKDKGRTQRQTMALKGVRYRLHAHIEPKREFVKDTAKFNEMFRRRASRGQCFQQPYFGCREFPAYFKPVEDCQTPVSWDADLGWMVYDVFDLGQQSVEGTRPFISLFKATVKGGVLDVPHYLDPAVHKPGRV